MKELSDTFKRDYPDVLDFRVSTWGWNLACLNVDKNNKNKATGIIIGKGIKKGCLIVTNGNTFGQVLDVIEVQYENNPKDMCHVVLQGFGNLEESDLSNKDLQ